MLKHQEIIEKLTTEQKLDLIVDVTSLGRTPIDGNGFKLLKSISLKDKDGWLEYPSFTGLINSWDTELVEQVANEVVRKNQDDGATLVELPNLGFKISPYSDGLSEDPYLVGELAKEIVMACNKNGIATCLSDPYIKTADRDYMDKEYSMRMQEEFFGLPYKIISKTQINVLKLSKPEEQWEYSQGNNQILQSFDNAVVISDGAEKGNFVKLAVNEGKFFVSGCRESLEEAIDNYEKLMKAFDTHELSLADVNRACDSGMALSPEMIDNAVDKILSFAEYCSSIPKQPVKKRLVLADSYSRSKKPLSVIAGEESIVMLKNDNNILPLKREQSVCLIGRLAEGRVKETLLNYANSRKISFNGYSHGYGSDTDITNDYLDETDELVKKSSVVIVAVGFDEKQSQKARINKNMRLPANQEALVRKICKTNKKVVLLVYGDNPIDMSFDNDAQGVLLIPSGGVGVAEATYNILYGRGCPGGRLANTYYENTDAVFNEIKMRKDSGRNEIGIYHGYRLYTSLNQKVKYPFGYGLSYTKFKYSNFKVRSGCVSVMVKNVGSKEGSELVQIYASKIHPTMMRPEKELKAFCKIRLKPGKSQIVTFKISELNFAVYSNVKNKMINEAGEYLMSVCSNASTEIFKSKFILAGENSNEKPFIKSKYLQSVSNIKDGQYYLEEPTPAPKFAYERNRTIAITLSYCMLFVSSIYLYLYSIKWVGGGLYGFITVGGLTFAPLMVALVLKARKNKFIENHIAKNKIMKKEKRNQLDYDLLCEEIPYEELFVEEFKISTLEYEKEDDVVEEKVKSETFINEVFNPDFTMPMAVEELSTYMKKKGIYVDVDSIRSLFASFASSRMLVLNADDKQLLYQFIGLLGKYFNCENVELDYASLREHGGDVINTVDDVTAIAQSLISNNTCQDRIRIMSIKNISSEEVKSCLQQVIRYIEQPDKELTFSVLKDRQSYAMPDNVWFILTLSEEEKAVNIPKYILESATVLDIVMRVIEEEPKKARRERTVEKLDDTITQEAVVVEESTQQVDTEEVVLNTQESDVVNIEENLENSVTQEEPIIEEPTVELITNYQFTKMIDLARRNFLLDEMHWKRLDKLEEYIISIDKTYRINNKMWQHIEKYVSVFLSAGGSNEESIDNVVAHYIINTMIPSVVNSKNKDSVKFTSVIENVFGEGHVPHSIRAIKSTGLKI